MKISALRRNHIIRRIFIMKKLLGLILVIAMVLSMGLSATA